jgi:Skp family chaperone for outer membrane proteins
MRHARHLSLLLAMFTCASVVSSADVQTPPSTSSTNTQVVVQQYTSAADALAGLDQMAQQHPELKASIEAAKAAIAQTTTSINSKQAGTAALPHDFQAQLDAVLKNHPELRDALAAAGGNAPQSGSSTTSNSKVIIKKRVVVDGKVVEDF